jgi:xanthine dehydrogenase accessory factor
MNENETLGMAIREQLRSGAPVVLVSLLSIQGSGPRHTGSRMVVFAQGTSGTIGGSLLEATAIRRSRGVLDAGRSELMDFELSGKDASSAGMICGGKVELLLDYIAVTPANRQLFERWTDASHHGQDFYFVTKIKHSEQTVQVLGHALLFVDGTVSGDVDLRRAEADTLRAGLRDIPVIATLEFGDSQLIVQRIQKLKTLYCFGAGHVAVPTSHIAAMVGFRVVIIDDRSEFANTARFPEASEIRVVPDLSNPFKDLKIDEDAFIVIVTRGHQFDRAVLEKALKTPAQYIGMISSRKKRDVIYAALKAQGVLQSVLDGVHSPIGLAIAGETPEEIAVSIVAELIDVRGKKERR